MSSDLNVVTTLATSVAAMAAVVAALFSWRSWQASERNVRAMLYDKRFAIYDDTEKFLGSWLSQGHPDMSLAYLILGAHNRSSFILPEVSSHLWEIWLNAIKADEAHFVHQNSRDAEAATEAARKKHRIFQEQFSLQLKDIFLNHLRVS